MLRGERKQSIVSFRFSYYLCALACEWWFSILSGRCRAVTLCALHNHIYDLINSLFDIKFSFIIYTANTYPGSLNWQRLERDMNTILWTHNNDVHTGWIDSSTALLFRRSFFLHSIVQKRGNFVVVMDWINIDGFVKSTLVQTSCIESAGL